MKATTVTNKDRKFGAAKSYVHVRASVDGMPSNDFLFTDGELSHARQRAEANYSDLPPKGVWEKFRDWLRS
jgi:hypothetical protein